MWAGRDSAICTLHFALSPPGPCHFNKEQTPLAILRYQPTVSRWFFRCLGAHLLRSPQNVKAFQIVSARDFASDGQSQPVESLGFPAPEFVWCCRTSSRRHFLSSHSALPFVVEFASCFGSAWVNKKPCFHSGKQGVEIRCLVRLPAHLQSIQTGFGLLPAI